MPYKSKSELSKSVRDNLPEHAQEIYREAYNSAWDQYSDPDDRREGQSREETAHRVAWPAVKKEYEKDEESGPVRQPLRFEPLRVLQPRVARGTQSLRRFVGRFGLVLLLTIVTLLLPTQAGLSAEGHR